MEQNHRRGASPGLILVGVLALQTILSVLLTAGAAFAQLPGGAKGASTGDGSTPFTGLAQAPEANLFVGASTTSIPIEVPKGRGKITPKITLVYNSGAGPSPYGFGWDIPLGRIQRSGKHGRLSCEDTTYHNDFVVTLPDGSVECRRNEPGIGDPSDDNFCSPSIEESFLRIKYEPASNGSLQGNRWEVWDRSGNHYIFGSQSTTREGSYTDGLITPVVAGGGCGYTSSWLLDRVEDPNGNYLTISYVSLGTPRRYPQRIQYGANPNDPGGGGGAPSQMFEVFFDWSSNVPVAYNGVAGFADDITGLLETIVIQHRLPGASA
jgi:hypothetical protein